MILGLLPSDVYLEPDTLLVVVLSLTATILSALISYQAYRGYRRNDSRAMLYLAIGFVFITTVPFFVELLFYPLFGRRYSAQVASVVLPTVRYSIQIVGLSFVLYSIYGQLSGAASEPLE